MRQATVRYKGEDSGLIVQQDDGSFVFRYNDDWYGDPRKPSISLTLPKTEQVYTSEILFPFFYNMLPEGTNKQAITQITKIDKDDAFGLLLAAARFDSIGAVTVEKL